MRLILDIDDSRYEAFLNFIKTLDYVNLEYDDTVLDSHVNEVRARLEALEKGEMQSRTWKEAEKDIFRK